MVQVTGDRPFRPVWSPLLWMAGAMTWLGAPLAIAQTAPHPSPILTHPSLVHPSLVHPSLGHPSLVHPSLGHPSLVHPSLGHPPLTRPPVIIHRPPIILLPYPLPRPETQRVRVEFDARGTDWGAVYLDNRLIYRPQNFDRQKTLHLPPGGYRLEITGVVRSDRWASGFLDLGRDSSRLVVIRFSKAEGVTVSGSPFVWIPD